MSLHHVYCQGGLYSRGVHALSIYGDQGQCGNTKETLGRSMNTNPPARARRPDYGIDAPGVRRAMLVVGSTEGQSEF